jgi:hypothetical protein
MTHRLRTVLIFCLIVACDRSGDLSVGQVFKGVPPLDALSGVRLGMDSSELLQKRVGLERIGSSFTELIGGRPVTYEISEKSMNPLKARGKVEAVDAQFLFENADSARAEFARQLKILTTQFHAPPTCYLPPAPYNWQKAIWKENGALMYAFIWGTRTDIPVRGPPIRGGGVRIGTSREGSISIGEIIQSYEHPCP